MDKHLELSVRRRDGDAVRRCIESGADIDARDRHGQTALMIAATLGDADTVRLLIEHGADLNVTAKYNLSALMLAVLNDCEDIVSALCAAGADTKIHGTGAPGFRDYTALDLAERAGRTTISALIRSASDPGQQ